MSDIAEFAAFVKSVTGQAHSEADLGAALSAVGKKWMGVNGEIPKEERTQAFVESLREMLDGGADLDGIYVWYQQGSPQIVLIDVMDWGDGDSGKKVGKLASKLVGDEAKVLWQNEGGKPDAKAGWEQLYPFKDEKGLQSSVSKTLDQRRVIAVDLNRTLAQGHGPDDFGEPTDGARAAMQELRERGYVIAVNSVVGDVDAIGDWLDAQDIPYDFINESPAQPPDSSGKLNAAAYLDDRAVPYRGDWRATLDDLYACGVLDKRLHIGHVKNLRVTPDDGYVARWVREKAPNTVDIVADIVQRLAGSHNLAPLTKIRPALAAAGIGGKQAQDDALIAAWRAGKVGGVPFEGRHGMTPEEHAAILVFGGERLGYFHAKGMGAAVRKASDKAQCVIDAVVGLADTLDMPKPVQAIAEWRRDHVLLDKVDAGVIGSIESTCASAERAAMDRDHVAFGTAIMRLESLFGKLPLRGFSFGNFASNANRAFQDIDKRLKAKSLGEDGVPLTKDGNGMPLALLAVPDVRQHDVFSCGAAAAMSVGRYFGVGPETLDEWKDALGTTEERSTNPLRIVDYLESLGLDARGHWGMTLSDLASAWCEGRAVICPIQEYGVASKYTSFAYGHYVTVVGIALGFVFVGDPAADNALQRPGGTQGDVDDPDSLEAPGRNMIPERTFLRVWHDQDADGNRYERFGIVVGRRGVAKGLVTKEGGSCEQGETAAQTGCVPASGGGGKKPGASAETDRPSSAPDAAANRPSKPSERHKGAAPKALPYQAPPPKVPRQGKFERPKGDASQTKLGDQAEALAASLGFRSILPPGQRCHKPGEVAKKGSTIDCEFDHSGRAYEIKMCQTSSTEYRLKAKKSEKDAKLKYARANKLEPYTMVGVRDVATGEVHFYAGKKPGLIGAEVNDKDYDFVGSVKPQ